MVATPMKVSKFEFAHLSSTHLERLQRIREELERAIALQHQIERKQIAPSLKNYWRVSSREKNMLRYETGAQEWHGESVY